MSAPEITPGCIVTYQWNARHEGEAPSTTWTRRNGGSFVVVEVDKGEEPRIRVWDEGEFDWFSVRPDCLTVTHRPQPVGKPPVAREAGESR